MKLAIISEGFHMWPLYAAHAARFFERAGVDVRTTLTGASGKQMAELARGEHDAGLQQSDHVVRAVEQGGDLFIFMANAHQPDLNLVVAPGITCFRDLRGQVVAVDGARSGYAVLQHQLFAREGLTERDYTLLEAGGVQARFDAVKSGRAVAAWLNPPYDQWLLTAGFRTLGTVNDFFPGYPGSIAAARRAWARDNEAELVAFIRAFNAAYDWLLDTANREEALEIAMARLKTERQHTEEAYGGFTAKPRPEITAEGLRLVVDAVWAVEGYSQARGAASRYLDLSYLAKAENQAQGHA